MEGMKSLLHHQNIQLHNHNLVHLLIYLLHIFYNILQLIHMSNISKHTKQLLLLCLEYKQIH
jgi:hypothetical protein